MSRLTASATLIRRTLCAMAVVLFMAVTVNAPVQAKPSQQGACQTTYVVQVGDNLFRIGLKFSLSWVYLAQVNGIANPNLVYVGETLCIPPANGMIYPTVVPGPTLPPPPTIVPPPTGVPPTGIVLPAAGVFPSISFDVRSAAVGDTITINGVNFPTNEPADILITPLYTLQPYTPVASTVTSAQGTVQTQFIIPTTVNNQPLRGYAFSIMVKGKQTGYFGYNYIYNSKP